MLSAHGAYRAAIEVYGELLEQAPTRGDLWEALASLHRRLGQHDEAAGCLSRFHEIELESVSLDASSAADAATFLMAAAGYAEAPAIVPEALVTAHFDERAANFEDQLVERLGYRGPAELFRLVAGEGRSAGDEKLDVLDLGCGTGLAGMEFRALARRLVGVDLSDAMLREARGKAVYDRLVHAELVGFLEDTTPPCDDYDLIVATDVFNYIGDLRPVFAACARRLRDGGGLAFTVEASETEGRPELGARRRFRHGRVYLERQLRSTGFGALTIRAGTLRYEHERPVAAFFCLGRWPGEPGPAETS